MTQTVPGMAEAIERRTNELGLTPGEFSQRSGLTGPGLAHVRRGERRQYQAKTRIGVARALRWPSDWYERLCEGEDPGSFDGHPPAPPVSSTEDRLAALEAQMDEVLRRLPPA